MLQALIGTYWIYLFLLCCQEVFACSVVTAISGLCNKTESLSPTDPRQKWMCWTVLGYCYTREPFLWHAVCVNFVCMCTSVCASISVDTVWRYEGCKILAASLETLGWQRVSHHSAISIINLCCCGRFSRLLRYLSHEFLHFFCKFFHINFSTPFSSVSHTQWWMLSWWFMVALLYIFWHDSSIGRS